MTTDPMKLQNDEPAHGCPFGHGRTHTPHAPHMPADDDGWHHAKVDFSASMSYGDYLSLGTILSAQHPLSPDHNEMLFIIQHQTTELWMKLAIYELRAARDAVHRDALPSAFKMLARVSRIFEQLVQAWSVLATMTPSEYTSMRPFLGGSSGFQSYQYRQLEFLLGNKNDQMLKPHAHRPDVLAEVQKTLEAPSFYDEVIRLLARRGFAIAPSRLERDWTRPTEHDASVEAAWLEVYRYPSQHWNCTKWPKSSSTSKMRFASGASVM